MYNRTPFDALLLAHVSPYIRKLFILSRFDLGICTYTCGVLIEWLTIACGEPRASRVICLVPSSGMELSPGVRCRPLSYFVSMKCTNKV